MALGERSLCFLLALPANAVISWKVVGLLKAPLFLPFFRDSYSQIFLKQRLSYCHPDRMLLAALLQCWRCPWPAPETSMPSLQMASQPQTAACPAYRSPASSWSFWNSARVLLWLCRALQRLLCYLKMRCFLLIMNSYFAGEQDHYRGAEPWPTILFSTWTIWEGGKKTWQEELERWHQLVLRLLKEDCDFKAKKSREWVKGFEMRLWDLRVPFFCWGSNSTVLLKPVRQSRLVAEVEDLCPVGF